MLCLIYVRHQWSQKDDLAILKTALSFEIGLPIQTISFEELTGAPEESIAYEHEGIEYGASLSPRLRMIVIYAVEGQLTSKFTLGGLEKGMENHHCRSEKKN